MQQPLMQQVFVLQVVKIHGSGSGGFYAVQKLVFNTRRIDFTQKYLTHTRNTLAVFAAIACGAKNDRTSVLWGFRDLRSRCRDGSECQQQQVCEVHVDKIFFALDFVIQQRRGGYFLNTP